MKESLAAVILAAGQGRRMGNDLSKAFLKLCEKPILQYSLEIMLDSPSISEIVIVVQPPDRDRLEADILSKVSLCKSVVVVHGGAERQDSSLAGVQAATTAWVAVHDGARPLFTANLLERVFQAAKEARAAIPTLPVSDSLRLVNKENLITTDVSREQLYTVQTPQCFERDLLLRSLQQACTERRYFSDEAGAVLAVSGIRARAVPGERGNIKVTFPEDVEWAEALIAIRQSHA